MTKAQWDKTRVGWFCLDVRNYAKYQKFIEDVCAADQNCKDETDHFVNHLKDR